MQEYPWYESIEGDKLQQGDFIDDCKVLISRYALTDSVEETTSTGASTYQVDGDSDIFNVVIVSQSCDLENVKVDYVLVCPRWSYTQVVKDNPKFGKKEVFDRIKQGKEYRYCFLDKSNLPDHPSDIQIVDFNMVFSIPYPIMTQIALSKGKRLRLRSPYKEKLAQAFAYFHMRVALPIDLPGHEVVKAAMQVSTKLG